MRIGTIGCAPALEEVVDPGDDDVLRFVQPADSGFEFAIVKS